MTLLDMLKGELRLGEFTLASGRTSRYYIDGRRVTLTTRGARAAADAVFGQLPGVASPIKVHAVGGPTSGADPIVGACLARAYEWGLDDLVGFFVRAQAKGHGTGNLVEGPLEPGMTVAIVDDVATSGGSLVRSAEAVRARGCSVFGAICLLDRLEGAEATLTAAGIPFYPLFTVRDLGVEPAPPG